jgi:predicted nuclease with TOPRIM domain
MSEARIEQFETRFVRLETRFDRVEQRLDRVEERLTRIEESVARIELAVARIEATLPHLATKAELADKPSRLYMWGVMAAMTGAYTAALAAIGVLLAYLPHH